MRAVLIVLLLAGVAHADDVTRAKALFDEGKQLATRANYKEACDRFAKSYDLDPALGTMLNFADCEEHLGHLARAWQLFDAAATRADRDKDAVRAQYARDRAESLVPRLGEVVVRIADTRLDRIQLTIGGRKVPAAAEVHERAEPGDVEVVAAAPERRFAVTAHVAAGSATSVDVPALSHEDGARRRGWVIASAGLGIGAIGAAAFGSVMAIAAVRRYDQAYTLGECSGNTCTPDGLRRIGNAHDAADLATVMFVGAGALAAAGVAVWWLAPRDGVEIAPTAGGNNVGVALRARF